MIKVAIFPIPTEGGLVYWAEAGDRYSEGATAGSALDALIAQLPPDEADTLLIFQSRRPDRSSTPEHEHLARLMGRWRAARDAGSNIPSEELTELNDLVEAEVRAFAARATAVADKLQRSHSRSVND